MSMDSSNLIHYLVIGSYLFGAASWLFLYREIKALRREVLSLRLELAFEKGRTEGARFEGRLVYLERASEDRREERREARREARLAGNEKATPQ